jgi:hypothetical protein
MLVGLLCFVVFLVALQVPDETGMIRDAGWLGVALFLIGLLCVEIPLMRHQRALDARARQLRNEEAEIAAGTTFFATPEEAALSAWDSTAKAFVVSKRLVGENVAEVVVDTSPSRPVVVRCERFGSGWCWTESEVSA